MRRKKNLFGRSGSQLLQAFVNFEDTLTTFRTRTGGSLVYAIHRPSYIVLTF
jgi:hypothetical protein